MTEFRDPYTAGHQQRVAKIAVLIGMKMGLSEEQVGGLRAAAIVHDIGKIAVPIEILSAPGILNPIQRTLVQLHVSSGYESSRVSRSTGPLRRSCASIMSVWTEADIPRDCAGTRS